VATAQELIRHYGLQPSDLQLEAWPWPLRINALGSFAVARNDSPLATKGKSPTRLLQLLKVIVANGRGHLSAPAVAALLWPEVDGDAAEQNLDIALSRLRKLLGVESALLLQDNKLSLDRTQCWVDAWVFEDLAAHAASLSPVELIGEAHRALGLYRGHFLAQDDEPWVLPMRERLRQTMIHLVLAAADACATDGKWDHAARFCQRGLALENLSEPLYRKLMQLHGDRGERAEALNVYHRCHDMLSTCLGVRPSTETQALYASLRR
jgi:DNA-binding SARP family transcriptional activator